MSNEDIPPPVMSPEMLAHLRRLEEQMHRTAGTTGPIRAVIDEYWGASAPIAPVFSQATSSWSFASEETKKKEKKMSRDDKSNPFRDENKEVVSKKMAAIQALGKKHGTNPVMRMLKELMSEDKTISRKEYEITSQLVRHYNVKVEEMREHCYANFKNW